MISWRWLHMKRKIICLLCALSLIVGSMGFVPAYGKTVKRLKLSKTKVSVKVGKTKIVKIKGSYKKVKFKVVKKTKVKVKLKGKKIIIKGVKNGTTNVYVKGYNKKGKLVAKAKLKVVVKKASGTSSSGGSSGSGGSSDSGGSSSGTNLGGETKDPSSETEDYDAGEYSISKVHTGEATFYDRESTGAANLDDYESIYYTAAMNNEDYMKGLAGAYIEVTDKDGDKVNVLITDRLPEGKKGDIDLSRSAFKSIEPEVTGRMSITWRIIPLPTDDPIEFLWKPTSTKYWAQVQIRNNRYPIKSVEYYDAASGKYVELPREEYNYFTAASGMGDGPYTFRITDFYGHVIVEKNVPIKTDGSSIKGSKNFEY